MVSTAVSVSTAEPINRLRPARPKTDRLVHWWPPPPLAAPKHFFRKGGRRLRQHCKGSALFNIYIYIYIYIVDYHHQERHPFRLPLSLPLRKTARCLRSTAQKRRWSAQCPWSRPPTILKDIQIVLRHFPVLGKKPNADHEIVEAAKDLDICNASSKTFVAVASFVNSLNSPGNDYRRTHDASPKRATQQKQIATQAHWTLGRTRAWNLQNQSHINNGQKIALIANWHCHDHEKTRQAQTLFENRHTQKKRTGQTQNSFKPNTHSHSSKRNTHENCPAEFETQTIKQTQHQKWHGRAWTYTRNNCRH